MSLLVSTRQRRRFSFALDAVIGSCQEVSDLAKVNIQEAKTRSVKMVRECKRAIDKVYNTTNPPSEHIRYVVTEVICKQTGQSLRASLPRNNPVRHLKHSSFSLNQDSGRTTVKGTRRLRNKLTTTGCFQKLLNLSQPSREKSGAKPQIQVHFIGNT